MQRLNTRAFGWVAAIVEVIFVLFAWFLATLGDATAFLDLLRTIYIGFDASLIGLLIGLVEALAVGFAFGYIMAWVYNHKVAKLAGGEVHHDTCSECGTKFETTVLLGEEEDTICTTCANE